MAVLVHSCREGPYSASALKCMSVFSDEVLSCDSLKLEFERLEAMCLGKEGPVSGWAKVDKMMTCVRGHFKKRNLPDVAEGMTFRNLILLK